MEATLRDKSRSHQPQGFVESAWHYAKIAFRLLFMNAPQKDHTVSQSQPPVLNGKLAQSVNLLKHAASFGDPDATFLLAEMGFYGNFSHPRHYRQAFEFYHLLASATGNSTAQYMLGFIYATGIGGAVERDQAKALLYHTFAAEQRNTRSEMTLGFRHHSSIGAARNCDKAAKFYKRVADKAMTYWRSGPPGGRNLVKESYHWADEAGGVYGEGASVSSSGFNANRDKNSHASTDDIMEYLDMLARKGDLKATFSLAKMYYDGSKNTKHNIRKAQRLFMKITRQYWDKHGKIISGGPKGIDKIAAKAAAHIGRMFLRGEGWEQSYEKAATWFRRGIANGDPICQYLMGIMYRDGLGVPKDSLKAATSFRVAADEDLAAAQSNLGILFLDQGEVETANRYFELAARHGHLEAFYYLAELTNKGIGRERHCGMATTYYKIVAESVEDIHSSFVEANTAYEQGDLETAVVLSMMAAEQGSETAQANAAYLIDEQSPMLKVPAIPIISSPPKRPASTLRDAALALIYWTRSAKQANIDSLLKMGDYYLSGFGTSNRDPEKASTCYHTAAEVHHSAQALWNLGWMHEHGLAVSQDFHMAKRYYDLALETNSEAYLPVKLALIKLRARSYWNTLTRGKINGIQAEPADTRKSRTLSEWIAHFLESADEDLDEGGSGSSNGLDDLELESAAAAGLGTDDAMPGGDESYYEEMDDSLLETLLIIGIAATLAFLVYYRQQRQLQQRRAVEGGLRVEPNAAAAGVAAAPVQAAIPQPTAAPQREQQQQQQQEGRPQANERGFFPNPGDPDYAAWAAGGVGH
jgi:SEL1 protein